MYSREYDGKELHFEASGGLMNSSLVMQDQETDTYWSIMTGRAEGGSLKGAALRELPVSEKVQWSEWKRRHPETLVLSVNGREWAQDGYADYWESPQGFGGQRASDQRLATKAPIYAFEYGGSRYAVAHERLEGGATFTMPDGAVLFLYRAPGAEIFASTAAWTSRAGFRLVDGAWHELGSSAAFDAATGRFEGAAAQRLGGFDTFWYNWSLNNPDTELLE